MKTLLHLSLWLLLAGSLASCHKDDVKPDDDSNLTLEQRMNKFIAKEMKDIYFWADQAKDPSEVSLDLQPADFLDAMKYAGDNWSYVEETDATTKSSSEGSETGFGYKIIFYRISETTTNVIGMIQYVYPDSPASKAGLKRGDMIVRINDAWMNMNNYKQAMTDASVKLQTGGMTETEILAFDELFELQASTITIDPIQLDTIIQIDNKKIGYLVYTSFVDNQSGSLTKLNEAARRIKDAGIDEFVLDLRYNNGGMETAAKRLASLLAPADAVRRSALLINKQWNATYQQKYSNATDALEVHFEPEVLNDNLDLQKIYILTGENTASASEVIISGLQAYIPNVILIGQRTVGKNAGMSKLTPEKDLQKWAFWPVTFTYTNANGKSVAGGIAPDYSIREYSNFLPPFGDTEDPLLGKAVELITGQAVTATLKSRSSFTPATHWKPLRNREKYLLIE